MNRYTIYLTYRELNIRNKRQVGSKLATSFKELKLSRTSSQTTDVASVKADTKVFVVT